MSHKITKNFWNRRDFLFQSSGGIAGLALTSLLNQQGLLALEPAGCAAQPLGANPYAPKAPHFAPRAKAVISLFMTGGPSAVDLFDYKPSLVKYAGEALDDKVTGDIHVRQGMPGSLMPTPFTFKPYGQSGKLISEVFPNVGAHADEIAFIHSVFGRSNDHVQSTYEMHTGQIRVGFPSAGSWITYGLGAESASLPAFVVLNDPRGGPLAGPASWSAGYMPAVFQGTVFRATGDPIVDLKPVAGMSPETQRARLDLLAKLNEFDMEQFPGNSELAARISSYELAYRMQGCAPQAVDLTSESEATKKLYGLDTTVTEPFGRQCLMARRLVENGVRFVQLFQGGLGSQNTDTWDAHSNVKVNHTQHAMECDQPIAALLTDLKARGLLDSTLVIWHGEFGRMPISQRGVGRDHNPGAMTVWMAGAGIKGGQSIGASDEWGYKAQDQVVSAHDLHATMLHLLGLDHKKLTYRFNGRDMRLTDVYGTLIPQIIA